MKKTYNILLILNVLIFNSLNGQYKLTAKEIVTKADEILRGVKTTRAKMLLKTVRPKWTRKMEIKTWSKGRELTMVLVTSPAREKGTAFLMNDSEVWNWVPSIERSIKLPPSMMTQSWMGTDFTNDDLVQQSSIIKDYDHEIIGVENVEGRPCYKIKLVPHEDAPVVWGEIVVWISKEEYFQLKVHYFDEEGQLINAMNAYNIKNIEGRSMPTKMEIEPVNKKGHKTVMEYLSIEFDTPIDDDFFKVQKMKRLK